MNAGAGADRRDVLAMMAGATVMSIFPEGSAAAQDGPAGGPITGRDQPFDDGWRFFRGEGAGLEAVDTVDAGWRLVDLPHDWSIDDLPGNANGPFRQDAPGGRDVGFVVGGEGWYRKHFRGDRFPADARVEVLFEGAYGDTEVWLNGARLGGNAGMQVSGYTPFAFDLTPHLNRSGDNVLAVRVRNLGENSRWYSGSGLYRPARLDVLPAGPRLARWGVAASTRRIDAGRAEVAVTAVVEDAGAGLQLVTRLRDASGAVAAEAAAPASATVEQLLTVPAAQLWSPDEPVLYTLETELRRGDTVLDRQAEPFGIRIIAFDAAVGMTINGTPTKIRGGCIHHDNGLLGARAYADADERRVRLLKARGYNALRSAHNASSRSLRSACDRLGMLLIEEAFDMWHAPKLPHDFSTRFAGHWEEVIRGMVLPARNSPSVIMWSIGNEVPQRSTDEGVEWAWKLANAVRRLDPTRPVTAGLNGTLGGPMRADAETARTGFAGKVDNASTIFLDVPGYNYRLADIEREQGEHPERVVYASETFPRDMFAYRALSQRAPYFLGEFVWTAMDYLGEVGVGSSAILKTDGFPYFIADFPWVNAWCGDIDLIGQQKPQSLARDVAWGLSPLEMLVHRPIPDDSFEFTTNWGWPDELPSWTWPGSEGTPLKVKLYTSGDRVELRLNGKPVGEAAVPAGTMAAEIAVPYAPGTLEAVAFADGREVARRKLETAGAPVRLRLTIETKDAGRGRQNLCFVGVAVVDAQGRVVPDAGQRVSLAIDGPAQLAAFGSADPQAAVSYQDREAETFRGRGLAVLRGQGLAGSVRVKAIAPGLEGDMLTIRLT